jgi:hypothetical protein
MAHQMIHREPTLEDYRSLIQYGEGGFLDIWLQAFLRGDDGNEYFISFSPVKMVYGDDLRLDINTEPLWCFTTPTKKIIEKGEKPEINILLHEPAGTLKTEFSSSSFTVKMAGAEVICSPPAYRFKYDGEACAFDLTLKDKGSPAFYKEEGSRMTPSTIVRGFEAICDVEGSMIIKGREIRVTGVGIHECSATPNMAWREYGWMDWIWFVFDDVFGLMLEVQGGGYKDGFAYLTKEKQHVAIHDFEIDHPQWAYSPVLQHHWPTKVSARAKTDKGILSLEGKIIYSQPWAQINKYRRAITLPASDMGLTFSGQFTFNDGRSLSLENGRGADEIIAVYNFAQ